MKFSYPPVKYSWRATFFSDLAGFWIKSASRRGRWCVVNSSTHGWPSRTNEIKILPPLARCTTCPMQLFPSITVPPTFFRDQSLSSLTSFLFHCQLPSCSSFSFISRLSFVPIIPSTSTTVLFFLPFGPLRPWCPTRGDNKNYWHVLHSLLRQTEAIFTIVVTEVTSNWGLEVAT